MSKTILNYMITKKGDEYYLSYNYYHKELKKKFSKTYGFKTLEVLKTIIEKKAILQTFKNL